MSHPRVLVQGRPDLFVIRGGDTVHITRTVSALADAGVEVSLSLEIRPDLSAFDLVHVFNLMRVDEGSLQIDNARRQGKPVVVTPLYWSLEEYFQQVGGEPAVQRRWPGEQRLRRKALAAAAAILVSGEWEARGLEDTFGVGDKTRVVPLGVEPAFALARPELFHRQFGITDFIFCAARVGPHKNQLRLVQAATALDLPLVCIGQAQDPVYHRLCRQAAGPRVHFLGSVDQNLLVSAFAAARVHAMPSWCEMPGLASLEAAAAGCRVVSTDRGTAPDYLGEEAWYVDPGDPEGLRQALMVAYQAPHDDRLAHRVRREFTWERAAAGILEIYQAVMAT